MNVRITQWLNAWNPWWLRKRIKELNESLDRLTDAKADFIDVTHRSALDENKRLKEENERLTRELALCTCNDEDEDGCFSTLPRLIFCVEFAVVIQDWNAE